MFLKFLTIIILFVKNTNWNLLQKLLERTLNFLRIFTGCELMRKYESFLKHLYSAVFRHFLAVFLEFSTISIFFVKNANWNFKWLLESTWNFLRISTGFKTAEIIQNFLEMVLHFLQKIQIQIKKKSITHFLLLLWLHIARKSLGVAESCSETCSAASCKQSALGWSCQRLAQWSVS